MESGVLLRAALVLLPPLLALGAYANALGNPFVYDDHAQVLANPSLREPLDWRFVLVHQPFRPLANASYALDRALFGLDAFAFHRTSLALHLLNTALVGLLFRRLGRARPAAGWACDPAAVALLAASLFAVHPMGTESVGYVAARAELLCAAFLLASWLGFERGLFGAPGALRAPALAGGLAAWLLALGCKEVAAMLPALLAARDACFAPPGDPGRRVRFLRVYLPMLAAVVAAGALRLLAYRGAEDPSPGLGLAAGWLTQLLVVWRYLGLFALPVGQSLVHQVEEVRTLGEPRAWLALAAGAALAGVAFAAWRARSRAPREAFGVLWFLLLLVPSSAIPLPELAAEHRTYLASAGLYLAAASLLARAPAAFGLAPPAARRAGALAAALLVAALAAATIARNRVWSDPVRLWSDAAAKAPWVFAPQLQLGDALRAQGRCEEALAAYRRALALVPEQLDARNHLGICLAQTGRSAEARAAFLAVLARDPAHARARRNLATLDALERDAARR